MEPTKYIRPKCEHGKIKRICIDCGGSAICEHKKIIYNCVKCGGGGSKRKKCEHGRQHTTCIDCGGSAICEHKRIKYGCVDCGGSAICEHKITKQKCKLCSPEAYCIHGKQKHRCEECGGTGVCEHGREKYSCKDCGGTAYCEHKKLKQSCKECEGSNICEHGIHKSGCRKCHGSGICEHDKHRTSCRECGGSAFCIHDKWKQHCVECSGGGICIHLKRKTRCKQCGGNELCKSELCENQAHNPKYNGYCLRCCIYLCPDIEVSRNYKTKENDVVYRIKATFPNFDWVDDKRIYGGCSLRRPDLLLDLGTHIIIIEVDENKHTDYDCSCEHKRLMELSQDVGHRPIVFIRFNPDSYTDTGGNIIKSCWKLTKQGIMSISDIKQWEERIHILQYQIQYWIDNPNEKMVEIVELFY